MIEKKCEHCGAIFFTENQQKRFCSRSCADAVNPYTEKGERRKEIERRFNIVASVTKGRVYDGMLTDVGDDMGVSREYVRQIIVKMGLLSPQKVNKLLRTKKCLHCKKEYFAKKNQTYCSPECRRLDHHQRYYIDIPCFICKKPVSMLRTGYIKEKKYFHSKVCQGKYIGNYFSRGRQSYCPTDPEELRKVLGTEPFTLLKFMKFFGYATESSAYLSLHNLMVDLVVKRIDRNQYQIL